MKHTKITLAYMVKELIKAGYRLPDSYLKTTKRGR